jgi:hypothetical protein
MNKLKYIEHLLNILSYDTLIDHLEVASRYWTHREIIENYNSLQRLAIITEAPGDVNQISETIIKQGWQRPELRWSSHLELEVWIDGAWKPFKPEDYVQ